MFAISLIAPPVYSIHLPAGVKEQMRQLLVTRFMFFAAMILLVFIVGVGLVMWIETKRPEKDNAALYIIICGFITTNIGVLLANAKGEKNQDTLQSQNIVLDQVHEKVNGGTTKIIEALKTEHEMEIQRLQKEVTRERHDLKGLLNHASLSAEHYQTEAKEKAESAARLEAQVKDLTDKLANCAKPGKVA